MKKNNFVKTTITFGILAAGLPVWCYLSPVLGAILHIGFVCIGAWKVSSWLTNGE